MNKILVIQTGKLGDMVCTTPVFRAIKNKYPNSQLFVSGDKINKEVLAGNPYINEYIFSNEISAKKIRNLKLDIAILLNPNPNILKSLILGNIKKIIVPKIVGGFSPYNTKIYKILSLFVTTIPHRMGHYAPQEYLNMLRKIDIETSDTKKELFFTQEAKEKIIKLIKIGDNKIKIGISPSAGNKIKNWGGKNFAYLADNLYKKNNVEIYIIGSERDKEEVNEMISNLSPDTQYNSLLNKLNIDELKAFISLIDVFISVDTGPIYIAEAFNVATIDIVGPMDENEQPPVGEKNLIVFDKNRKRPQIHIMNARVYNQEEALKQINNISVGSVLNEYNKLESLLNRS